jgi:hypothetical protein
MTASNTKHGGSALDCVSAYLHCYTYRPVLHFQMGSTQKGGATLVTKFRISTDQIDVSRNEKVLSSECVRFDFSYQIVLCRLLQILIYRIAIIRLSVTFLVRH